jgi:hypothetical protein
MFLTSGWWVETLAFPNEGTRVGRLLQNGPRLRPISRLPHRLATDANFPRAREIHLRMEVFDCQSVLAEVPDRWREMHRAPRTPAWRYSLLACDPFHVLRRAAR